MRYTVRWSRRALDVVTQVWLENPADRAAITESVNAADELFAFDPLNQGESRDDGRRWVILRPLVFTIQADEAERIVRVLNVRYPRRRDRQ